MKVIIEEQKVYRTIPVPWVVLMNQIFRPQHPFLLPVRGRAPFPSLVPRVLTHPSKAAGAGRAKCPEGGSTRGRGWLRPSEALSMWVSRLVSRPSVLVCKTRIVMSSAQNSYWAQEVMGVKHKHVVCGKSFL